MQLNAYTYVLDPVNFADYSGQSGFTNFLKAAVKVAIVAAVVVGVIALVVFFPEVIPAVTAAVVSAVNRVVSTGSAVVAKAGAAASKGAGAVQAGVSAASKTITKVLNNSTALPEARVSVLAKATNTLNELDETGRSPFRSAPFANDGRGGGQILPKGVNYTEHDVNPLVKGALRGTERLVTGDDGSAWYSVNHYQTFERLR